MRSHVRIPLLCCCQEHSRPPAQGLHSSSPPPLPLQPRRGQPPATEAARKRGQRAPSGEKSEATSWQEKGHWAKRQRSLCESQPCSLVWNPGANDLTPYKLFPHLCPVQGQTVSIATPRPPPGLSQDSRCNSYSTQALGSPHGTT